MAKKSSIVKNERRRRTVAKYAAQRAALLAEARDMSRTGRQRFEARQKLALLPHDANPNRIRNRDGATGRPARIHSPLWTVAHFLPGDGS